jgi:demethylmenaquinone methyltransferase/2-methoxy-6-polyprenyl-1,4-benzoquinol methylase
VNSKRTAAEKEHASRVRAMFASISVRYDLLNHLLSGNMDKRWRRKVAVELREGLPRGAQVLDVACGTGDLAVTLFELLDARVVGTDFCRPMLEIATVKAGRLNAPIPFVEADALALPFGDGSFDAVTIAFGLRNLANVEGGLRELSRVLKPGGQAAILEFSSPQLPGFRAGFKLYFTKLLPLVGGLVSGSRSAYEYLPDSVSRFPDQERLASMMGQAGFDSVRYLNLTGGVAALHLGTRPQRSS